MRNDSATAATLTVGGNNATSAFSGTLGAGAGVTNLVKIGTGVLTLSGVNSYAGNTTVSDGALQLTEAGNRSYAGQLSGSGVLLKSGAGTLTLAHADNSIGRLRLDGGALTVTGGLTSSGTGTVAIADFGGATLNVSGGNVTIGGAREFVVGLQSTGAVNVSSGALTLGSGLTIGIGSHAGTSFGANGDGTLNVSGGVVTIQGTSAQSVFLARPRTDNGSTGNFTGTINLTGGVLETARGFAEGANTTGGTKTSTLAFNGGTLRALGANANWIDASIDTVSLATGGGVIDTNGHDVAINRAITGVGALTKNGAGTLTLGGANDFSGGLVINGGTVALGASDILAGVGGLTLAGGTFAAGTFTDTLGALTLGAGINTITLGAGAALAFADSSAISWGANTLSVAGTFLDGASIRFGDSASGLSGAQLAAITVNGQAVSINSLGYLTAIPEPSAFALLAGLAGLGCAATRRRRRA